MDYKLLEELEIGWEGMSYTVSEEDVNFEGLAELIRKTVDLFKQDTNHKLSDYISLIAYMGSAKSEMIRDVGRIAVSKTVSALLDYIDLLISDCLNSSDRTLAITFEGLNGEPFATPEVLYDIDEGDFSEIIEVAREFCDNAF